ncbi:MAG TPA: glycosyltransferase family 2 protein [Gammaproteobacteria bacterium]|nr:glycosyltransferase family 2 protein [Gammaproteobacteria bacterium]HDZ77705.1 glycosyltransferase family 2 protein [Gammaproteobacteria bacterium]
MALLQMPDGIVMCKVSVLIYTLNEEIHLPLCLESLKWCDDVIIVDSFSTDKTEAIAKENGARFFQHAFEGFGSQRNWSLENIEIKNDWVLILDADEKVPDELADELCRIASEDPSGIGAWRMRRRFYMWGRWLRYSSLYPTWVVRFVHKDRVRYINRGHAETQEVKGEVRDLENDLIDENLKGMDEWFERQNRYSSKDAEYELQQQCDRLRIGEVFTGDPLKRRATLKRIAWRLPFRPFLYFVYSYIIRLGFLDGKDGLVFCLMKVVYQQMIVIKKYDARHKL